MNGENSGFLGMANVPVKTKICDIAYHLPSSIVTNEELQTQNPKWDMSNVEERSGVVKRHIAKDNETSLDLAYEATQKLFAQNPGLDKKIDGIIFCTQSPDYIMPPNSCILQKMLDLPKDIFAFDFNLACSGYIYGLALCQGLIASNIIRNILLVMAETYSKYIHEQDRSARVLFGDGAAATWLSASNSDEMILDIECSTSGKNFEKFIIPAGGCRLPKSEETSTPAKDYSGNIRTQENIHMDGLGILMFVKSMIPKQIYALLDRNSMSIDEIDLFVFHQASGVALDSLEALMKIKPEKVFRNIRDIGNTVSASIPIALTDAKKCGRIKKGDTVLLCGFGVGLSWGTAIYRF